MAIFYVQEFNLGLFDHLIATDDGKLVEGNQAQRSTHGKEKGEPNPSGKKKNGKQAISDSEFGVVRGIDFKNVQTVSVQNRYRNYMWQYH